MLARTIAIAAIGVTVFFFNPVAASADDKGVYVGVGAGVNVFPEDSDLGSAEADLDWSWATAGALGYAFGNGLRLEGEIGYRPNDVDSVTGVTGASGDYSTLSFMTNLLYDFRRPGWIVTPYIGVGIGAARVHADGVTPSTGVTIDDSSFGFAMQGIVGASYDINQNLALTADYRHIRVPDLEFDTSAGTSVDSDYATNQFMVGLRYRFGAPAAKPAPAPAPAAQPAPAPAPAPKAVLPKEFLVFFDFDRADLTPEGRNIVKSAAESAKAGGSARIVLTGHADRAGPAAYNVGLSQRRAETVKAELVRLGLSSAEITTQAKGETEPLVPTADGVPEPQNRRVEIVIR